MKTLIIQSLKQASEIGHLVSAFIVPIDKFSSNYEKAFTLEEVKKLKKFDKEIFVSVNKNISNKEVDALKKLLLEIEKLEINGIIFYDVAVVNLKEELNLKTPLVWAQEHLTTNYKTVNYWYNKGCEYAYISAEITKQEMEKIKSKTKAKLFVQVFGHIPMFTSKRHLVSNYEKSFLLNHKGKTKIYKEGKFYPIIDSSDGTVVYTDYILNPKEEMDFDYLVYNPYLIRKEDLKMVLEGTNNFPEEKGFLYKETIFKVKKDD